MVCEDTNNWKPKHLELFVSQFSSFNWVWTWTASCSILGGRTAETFKENTIYWIISSCSNLQKRLSSLADWMSQSGFSHKSVYFFKECLYYVSWGWRRTSGHFDPVRFWVIGQSGWRSWLLPESERFVDYCRSFLYQFRGTNFPVPFDKSSSSSSVSHPQQQKSKCFRKDKPWRPNRNWKSGNLNVFFCDSFTWDFFTLWFAKVLIVCCQNIL